LIILVINLNNDCVTVEMKNHIFLKLFAQAISLSVMWQGWFIADYSQRDANRQDT